VATGCEGGDGVLVALKAARTYALLLGCTGVLFTLLVGLLGVARLVPLDTVLVLLLLVLFDAFLLALLAVAADVVFDVVVALVVVVSGVVACKPSPSLL